MKFKGLVVAANTPFQSDLELDLERIPSLTDYLVGQKLAGLFVCGSTGECSGMTAPERKAAAGAFIKAAAGRIPVIAHVGSDGVRESQELAAHAESAGADAIAAVAPYYFRPGSVAELVDAMAQISEAAPKLPFYFYHIPALTGVNFPVLDFLKAAEKRIPMLAGVKFTYENLMDFQLSLNYDPERFQLLFGRDEILLAGLALGAEGGVGSTYNYAAPLYHRMIAAFRQGDMETARKLQLLSQKLVLLLMRFGGSAGKQIMELIGQPVGPVRPPTRNTFETNAELAAALRAIGVAPYLGGELVIGDRIGA